jgi:hypothetical protein
VDVDRPDGRPAPPGMFRLGSRTVTVPAHGTASVSLTADPSVSGPDGAYGGWLVASGSGATVRTAVGLNKEIPSYDLKIRMLDRNGDPAREDELHVPYTELVDVSNGVFHAEIMEDGTATFRVARGTYALNALFGTANEGVDGYNQVLSFQEPSLVIDRDTELVLDGRSTRRVEMRAPVADASLASAGIGYIRKVVDFQANFGTAVINPMNREARLELYLAPSRARGDFTAFGHAIWARLPENPSPHRDFYLDSPYVYHDVARWDGRFPDRPSLVTSPNEYARVDAAYPATVKGEVGNRWAFPLLSDSDAAPYVFTSTAEMNLPFRRAEYYSVRGGTRWSFQFQTYHYLGEGGEIDMHAEVFGPPMRYRAGRTYTDRWNAAVFGPSLPAGVVGSPGWGLRGPWVFRDGDSITVSAPMFADAGRGRIGDTQIASEHTTLHRDGELLGSSDALIHQVFAAPPGEASYRLTKDITRSDSYPTSTRITAEWTFRSKRTPDGSATGLPLLTVRYTPRLDDYNRAPAGRFELPVRVERQTGTAPIRSLTVEASYDDGATWHRTPVRRTATGWTAVLDHPARGLVSLRAEAADTAGNRVRQTIQRAYEIG